MKKILSLTLVMLVVASMMLACSKDTVKGTVNLAVEADHDKVASKIATGEIDIAILPEPKATVAINQAKKQGFNYSIKLNISNEWSDVSENDLAMGCIAVRNDLIKNSEASVVEFLEKYKASIEYIGNSDNTDTAAQLIVDAKILPQLPIAKSALANLYGAIVYSDGNEMKETLKDFYSAIELPSPKDDFYYVADKSMTAAAEKKIVIGVMNGPTGMGMAKLMSDEKNSEKYEFRLYSDPSLATADLTKGEIDMACLPTNTAAALYNKGAEINVAAINCLGSLYVVVKDGITVESVDDLIDKTVYYGVPNSTTKPIIAYILKKNKIEVNSEN